MSNDEFSLEKNNAAHNDHDHEHDHDHAHGDVEEAIEEALELDTQSRIFLEMRQQNLELLRIATQVAGYAGSHGPLKPGDVKNAMRNVWEIYAEFYSWIDPEESENGESEDDEEDEDD